MRSGEYERASGSIQRIADGGWLTVATALLAGLITVAYGYFHHSRIGLVVGLAVTAAGVLGGIVHGLRH